MPILPIAGAAAGLLAGGTGLARVFKDDLGFSAADAADQELQQGTRKGFNAKEGTINRSLLERTGDILMGNSREDILKAAQDQHLDNLQSSRTGSALMDARPDFEITNNMTQREVDRAFRKTEKVDPIITQIRATGELDGKYTTEELQSMDSQSLMSVLKEARQKEKQTDYTTDPFVQQQLNQQQLTNQIALGQMDLQGRRLDNQMEIQMMNNQLEMRRQDSLDRRADRKDRQAMIQQMMQGLATLGTSIAV